jgi:pimeloyl-ACP methyl ester carboxylesterase
VFWIWLALATLSGLLLLAAAGAVWFHFWILGRYLGHIERILTEKPLFIPLRGLPAQDAEDVTFPGPEGLTLRGCYLPARAGRRGVILFGPEFGSNRWACLSYCRFLREAGFDVFAFEPRGQGDSDPQPGYEPLQWVTAYEVQDFRAALAYLKDRPDADPRGVGLFGVSKGAGAGLLAAAQDPYVRCCVTDGAFATHTTMVPYMRKWIAIYSRRKWLQRILPVWYYRLVALTALRHVSRERGCRFPHLERRIGGLAPRPLLMIHGAADTYIKPEMARELYDRAGEPKDLWLVEGAKHNQALRVANGDYQARVLAFFEKHLAAEAPAPLPAVNGHLLNGKAAGVRKPGALTARD